MENISNLGFSKDFLTITQRAQATEEKKSIHWTSSMFRHLLFKRHF